MCPGCFLGYLERFVALKAAPSAIPTPVPIATPKAILFIMNPKAVQVMIPAIIPYVTALPSPLEGSCGLGLPFRLARIPVSHMTRVRLFIFAPHSWFDIVGSCCFL